MWKNINVRNNNDFVKTQNEIDELLLEKWINIVDFHNYLNNQLNKLMSLKLPYLWEKILPPEWY